MLPYSAVLTPLELQSEIVRDPLIVAPNTTVMDAITQMSGVRSLCPITDRKNDYLEASRIEARSSCVLVVEDGQLIGILTERDVVRLSAQQQPLTSLVMRQVMVHPVITLSIAAFTDLFSALHLLQHHRIRHLPILDKQNRLVGLVTHESLRRTAHLIDLLRLRQAKTVMTRAVVCATPDCSMLAIAQLMADHRVSSVVITEPGGAHESPVKIPVGILTERDLVQFQALGLNLDCCPAKAAMSTPVFAISPEEPLSTVRQIMEQQLIRRLVVTGNQGELMGIVTQTSLLQALNPLELYNLAKGLETQVADLEAEKLALLESRTAELERQVEARTAELKAKAEREKLLAELATQIRASLSLQTILDTTATQVRQILGCDRVNIWQLEPDGQIIAVAESTHSSLSLIGERINDIFLQQNQSNPAIHRYIRVIPDINTIEMADCHRDQLVRLQTRAKILVPLLCGDRLWGVLNATESQHPRDWQPEEVELLQALSVQLAIAIQQATTYQQLQEELLARQQAEAHLRESKQHYATLIATAPVGIFQADAAGNYTYVNDRWYQISGMTPAMALDKGWQHGLHPDDRNRVVAAWEQTLQHNCPFQLEYRFQHPDGAVTWVYGQSIAEQNASGKIVGYVGTVTDISDRKRSEEALQTSEAHQRALMSAIPDLIMRINRVGIYLEFVATPNFQVVGNLVDLVGTHVSETLPPKQAEQRLRAIQLALQTNSIQIYEQDLSIDGRTQVEEVRVVPYSEDEVLALVRDISEAKHREAERRQVELALRQSEAQSRAVLAAIPDLMFRVGVDGLYRGFVTYHREFDVISHDIDPTGQSMVDVLPPDLAARQLHYLQQAIQTGKLQIYEQSIQVGDRVQEEEVRVVKSGDDEALFMIRDITERKRTEAALRQSEQTNRTIIETMPDLLIQMDREGRYSRFLGGSGVCVKTPCKSLLEPDVYNVLPPNLAQQRLAYANQALETGNLQVYEQVFNFDGDQRYEEVRIAPLNDQEVLIIIRDITERKQAEAERLQAEKDRLELKLLEQILDVVLAGYWDWDIPNHREYLSPGLKRMFGYADHELPNTPETWQNLIFSEDLPAVLECFDRHVKSQGKEPFHNEVRYRHKDGSTAWVICSGQVIEWDADGQPLRMIGCHINISDRKRAEAQLQRTNEELARATRLKDEFLANMSHELRTPLNAILGMTEGLHDEVYGKLNQAQLKALQTIERSGSHLLELINDVLDVAKIESGQIELNYTPTAVASLCRSSLAFIKQQALKKRIQLEINLPPTLPDLLVDERRIRQVLINLLTNAVKFTHEGGHVTLTVSRQPVTDRALTSPQGTPSVLPFHVPAAEPGSDSPQETPLAVREYLQIAVRDTGIGIAAENISKLFQPFVQIDSALNRQYTGTGLGLALVKRIVDLHGGHVGLTSQVGCGSCFTIDLPYLTANASTLEADTLPLSDHEPDPPGPEAPLILIVEDNEANIATLANYLTAKGYCIFFANNGFEAIAQAQAKHPNLILMDIQMPGMDGLEAIQQIRQIPDLVAVPIIALTALAMEGDRERCLAAGANDYLSKPVRLKELATIMQQLLVPQP